MNKKLVLSLILTALMVAVAACGGSKEETTFKVSGLAEVSFSAQSLSSIEMVAVEYTEKDGSVNTYNGYPLTAVIALAGISDFSLVTMRAADGYSADVTADELAPCLECIVALDDEGNWRTVMPGFSGKQQVKDLVELDIQ